MVTVAGCRLRGRLGSWIGALVFALALQAVPAAAEETGGAAGAQALPPLADTPGAEDETVEAATDGAPEPTTVPPPPEQSPDDEVLIELPIAPAVSRQTDSEETRASETDASGATAAIPNDIDTLQSMRVLFPADDIKLDADAESELLRLAGYLNRHEAQRVVLRAHAADGGQGSSHDRRKSLARALAVRTFLVDRGVPADRIYLRPLGSEVTDGPPDRVDILPLRP